MPTPTPPIIVLTQPGSMPATLALSGPGIAAIVAFLLSLALTYVPHFATWWQGYQYKRTVWAIAGLVVALALVILDYLSAINIGVPRPFLWSGLSAVITAWLAFAGSAQLTYTINRYKLPTADEIQTQL